MRLDSSSLLPQQAVLSCQPCEGCLNLAVRELIVTKEGAVAIGKDLDSPTGGRYGALGKDDSSPFFLWGTGRNTPGAEIVSFSFDILCTYTQ